MGQTGALAPIAFIVPLLLMLVGALVFTRRRAVHMRIPARVDSIRPLGNLVSDLGRKSRFNDDAIHDCRLAVDEACANIIEHSYAGTSDGEIEVRIQFRRESCTIELTDFGIPYDPSDIPAPKFGIPVEDARPGGLGLYLMRSVMDKVEYTPHPRGNRLRMIRYARSSKSES